MAASLEEPEYKKKKLTDKPPSGLLTCHAIRLKPGEELVSGLKRFVSENDLGSAFVLTCVGSVRSGTIRLANATVSSKGDPNEIMELNGQFEILSLVGTISGGGHLHVSLGDKEGRVIGGHVMGNMIIFTTAEVVIGNSQQLNFTREFDEETGFDELVIRPLEC
ncbi:bifunctional protein GlmU [Nematostella vectensis]|uniref:bifunctional protein GlmU n=1 Tax=Nematostella vectensis TaxID=45351 RepID=UPI002076F094|nr:bifunctional protein GlmU [Nematostella vectensis]